MTPLSGWRSVLSKPQEPPSTPEVLGFGVRKSPLDPSLLDPPPPKRARKCSCALVRMIEGEGCGPLFVGVDASPPPFPDGLRSKSVNKERLSLFHEIFDFSGGREKRREALGKDSQAPPLLRQRKPYLTGSPPSRQVRRCRQNLSHATIITWKEPIGRKSRGCARTALSDNPVV